MGIYGSPFLPCQSHPGSAKSYRTCKLHGWKTGCVKVQQLPCDSNALELFFLLDTEMVFYHDSPCLLFSGHQTPLERQVFSTAPLLHWLHKSVLDSNCRTFCAVLWRSSHVELHLVVAIIVGSLGGLNF